MSKGPRRRRSRRLNLRALAVLGASVLAVAAAVAGLRFYRNHSGGKTYLAQARRLVAEKQPTNLILGHLNRYLELNPDDADAMELKAQVLADAAVTPDQRQEAIQALSRLIGRLERLPAERDRIPEARRRLVRQALALNTGPRPLFSPAAAEEQARKLIEVDGADDAEAHRMLAAALAGNAGTGKDDPARFATVLKEYRTAEEKDPGDVQGAARLAEVYRNRLGDRKRAEEVFARLLVSTADDPVKRSQALLARAEHDRAVGTNPRLDPEERAAALRRKEADVLEAVKADPSNVDARLAAAEAAATGPRVDTAAARLHLTAIPEAQRNEMRVKRVEGIVDLAERRVDDAVEAWRSGLVLVGGTDVDLTFHLANVLLDLGRLAEAEPLIEQFRRLTGGEEPVPEYRYLRGIALWRGDRPRDAIAELEAARYKIRPALSGSLLYALGMAYETVRDYTRAQEVYRQATEAAPNGFNAWIALARLQAETDLAEAEATLRRAQASSPGDPLLATELARVLWLRQLAKPASQRRWDEVEQTLSAARQVAPGSVQLAIAEAEFFRVTGRPDDGIALLRSATAIAPKASELWLALANALVGANKLGEATEALDKGSAPEAAGPHAGLAITRANILFRKGQVADGRKVLTEALTRVPGGEKPLLWRVLGDVYTSQKDYTSARAAYDEWSRAQPDNPDPLISLFNLAMATGDDAAIARAIETLKKVGGRRSYYWRFARVQDLLRARPKEAPDAARDAARLKEAEALAEEIKAGDPMLPLGPLLEAQVAERRKETDRAIAAYKKAIELKAGAAALNPLVALLVHEGREAELRQLREDHRGDVSGFDRMAALQALRAGDAGRAEELAEKAVQGDPDGLDVRVWQADVLATLGKPEQAEKVLRETIGRKPHDAIPWLALLVLQVSQKQTEKAAATVEQIRAQVHSEKPELLWANCYRRIGDTRRAEEYYQQALRKWPNDMTVLTAAVTLAIELGRADEAEAALRSIHRHDPSNRWATRTLARILARRVGNRAAWEEALALAGPEDRPDDVPDDLLVRAEVYATAVNEADRARAVAILEKLLAQQPDQPRLHEQLARTLFVAGDVDGARPHAAAAAKGDDAGADAILLNAAILLAAKDVDGAEAQLKRLPADGAGVPAVAELRARVLAARGKAGEGAAVLEAVFAAHAGQPDEAELGRKIANALNGPPLNQPEAAERLARKLAALNPQGRCFLAEVLASHGKADEAAAELKAAADAGEPAATASALNLAASHPDDPRWLALAERALGPAASAANPPRERLEQVALFWHLKRDFAREVETYRQILAAGTTSYLFLNNMAWTLSEELNQPEEGLKCADEAVKRIGAVPAVLDTRGVILTRLGRLDDALKDLEAAAAGRTDPALEYHLARAYLKKGDAEKARTHRDRARAANLTRDALQPCDRADWDEVMN